MSFSAPSATAIAAAAVSALTLYAWPRASEPMVATTGTALSAMALFNTVGSTEAMSPTKPNSGSRCVTRSKPASCPETPTAAAPCTLIEDTNCGFTVPSSTMLAISPVSASVTRRPLRNSGFLPRRSISALICGPPPCTTTGLIPTACMSAMSCAKVPAASASVAPASALPPYFTTTVLPANC